jgi:hypothetical protein
MLDDLQKYLEPGEPNPLPAPAVSVVSATERTVGLGHRRGTEPCGSFAIVALKGGRLDAVVRFQCWASDPEGVDLKIKALHERLLQARDTLWVPRPRDGWSTRFLRLAAEGASLAEHIPSLNAWRKTADYRALYEFHYEDADGAESLIARIPIAIDDEYGESTVVTDEMVRWDSWKAPTLEVHGGVRHVFHVGALSILAYLPDGWNGKGVTVSVSVGGIVRTQPFESVRQFRDAFDLEKEEGEEEKLKMVTLGTKPYVAGRMVFPNTDFPDPIVLKGGEDVFRVRYADPDEGFRSEDGEETDAVVYLRVLS